MPIRMTEDNPQSGKKKKRSSGASSGGKKTGGLGGLGGGLSGIAGSLLPMLLKKPKLLIILIILGVAGYFIYTNYFASDEGGGISNFITGGEFDKEKYEATEIYEPLANNAKNPLPDQVSLLNYAPKRLSQGQQGSCVAWASAYAGRTILESRRTGKDPNTVRFSPSFMYNQISIDHQTCQGSYIKLAMDNMMNQGALPYSQFKYDPASCSKEPSSSLKQKASSYKIRGFQRLTEDGQSLTAEMLSIQQNLAAGSPVIIGMMVGGSFMNGMIGKEFWFPTNADMKKKGFGGHALCVIGYDNFKEGGAFQIMNSWGEKWGKKGIFWIRYSDFKHFNVESYGLYPMGDASAVKQNSFKGSFGLELNSGAKSIALKKVSGIYFETVGKLTSKDKFKVEFTNNIECYTYIFGKETDGTSYVLFPHTAKHSPYCGITGTRLFPRDYSMQADNLGTKDKIAVLITKEPIDYNDVNKRITQAKGNSYEQKVENALKGTYETNIRFKGSQSINFETSPGKGKGVVFVIGVNK